MTLLYTPTLRCEAGVKYIFTPNRSRFTRGLIFLEHDRPQNRMDTLKPPSTLLAVARSRADGRGAPRDGPTD